MSERKGGEGLGEEEGEEEGEEGEEEASNTGTRWKWIGCVARSICFLGSRCGALPKRADSSWVSKSAVPLKKKRKGPPHHYSRDVEIM